MIEREQTIDIPQQNSQGGKKVVSNEKQIKSNPELPNPMVDLSKVKEVNEGAFVAAHGERKVMNLQKIKEYMQKRVESIQERIRTCDIIKSMYLQKQKNTKLFLKNIIRFFQDYSKIYSTLYKSINKLELKKKYQNHVMYSAIKQSVSQLIKLNDEQSQHVQKFVDWLQKILIQGLKSADIYFKERMKKLNKDLQNSDSDFFHSWQKQQKNYQKLNEGNDLLQKQLILIQNIKNTNQTAITRSIDINTTWEHLIQQQSTIKKLLKDNIIQFYQRFIKFHKKTDTAISVFKYWTNLPPSANIYTIYASFLDNKSVQYILFGSKSKKINQNFQNFMKMVYQQQRVGNPNKFLQILISKKYISKIQISQRQWKQVRLIFTVDNNLLIVDEKQAKTIIKLRQSSIKIKRLSQNIVQLCGIQLGVIFNSKKKQNIHFQTIDEVQEFVYYVNAIPNKKQQEK